MRREWWGYSQDRDDGLAVLPTHLLNVPNGRDQIACTARSHEQPIPLNEELSHTDRLRVHYPTRQDNKTVISVNHSHSISVPGPGGGAEMESNSTK